jgi:hypothetical protein
MTELEQVRTKTIIAVIESYTESDMILFVKQRLEQDYIDNRDELIEDALAFDIIDTDKAEELDQCQVSA